MSAATKHHVVFAAPRLLAQTAHIAVLHGHTHLVGQAMPALVVISSTRDGKPVAIQRFSLS